MRHIVGNMLENATCGYMIHGCNCQGVMGSGIALFIKNKWPQVFEEYYKVHDRFGGLKLGDIVPVSVSPELVVINCMTQDRFGTDRRHVDYEAVVACMENIAKMLKHSDTPTDSVIHTPLIGAGLAGGNWNIMEAIIGEILEPVTKEVVLWTLPNQELPTGRLPALPTE